MITLFCTHKNAYWIGHNRVSHEDMFYCPDCKKKRIIHKYTNQDTWFHKNIKINEKQWDMKPFADICNRYGIKDIGEFSDGYHTFNSLYHQRLILFATIVNMKPELSWKSRRHEDGSECFGGGWFIVGIDTPEGSYTYHYENKDWELFKCRELEIAKHWDGHTDKDVDRILSLR